MYSQGNQQQSYQSLSTANTCEVQSLQSQTFPELCLVSTNSIRTLSLTSPTIVASVFSQSLLRASTMKTCCP